MCIIMVRKEKNLINSLKGFSEIITTKENLKSEICILYFSLNIQQVRWSWIKYIWNKDAYIKQVIKLSHVYVHVRLWCFSYRLCYCMAVIIRAVFKLVSKNQNQSNYSNQSQQTQITQWTNQKLKQIQVINVKCGKTHGFTSDWLRKCRKLF